MDFIQHHKLLIGSLAIAAALLLFILSQIAVVVLNGESVPAPSIPRDAIVEGEGKPVNYVVLGDSTAVSQGSGYDDGVAIATQRHLAENNKVTMTNLGESGARTADVTLKQVPQIKDKPDVVLIIVGSNDVNHLTSKASVKESLSKTIDHLVTLNCDVKIIVTGAAQMGAVARFPQPLRWLAGLRTTQINNVFESVSQERQLTFAQLAEKTGQAFRDDSSLFAQDKFHPNAAGYAVWVPVLNQSLDEALSNQPSHCKN